MARGRRSPNSYYAKTKMCVFHLWHTCKKGDKCSFAHSEDELQDEGAAPGPRGGDGLGRASVGPAYVAAVPSVEDEGAAPGQRGADAPGRASGGPAYVPAAPSEGSFAAEGAKCAFPALDLLAPSEALGGVVAACWAPGDAAAAPGGPAYLVPNVLLDAALPATSEERAGAAERCQGLEAGLRKALQDEDVHVPRSREVPQGQSLYLRA
eukprot:CAMPEP_0179011152 /NCGR_PEP_ID=MMETSP0796-20121207/511_1 /TAXON_ID=73915 /ORGANISM="Pyrodinium bahamense, Strain pbaha01" /LENGTH=208 /DNA_ID=CAMNT_0020706511 /DNA_START=43 /DNA_END=673 /DNA_ORIENTATION=-